ncbi:iron complex outermembrane receptor protein [Altererythrobacter atlanticus]|uniref:Pesticin receptor n=1 Tax=Croceibacterium atlanticum TaxID=1267766 RepID=A0A0F7KQL9_9SPHN|nr:TonB-dependent receptor [Croceibacterium atlanticum]AKH41381.1 Pesticin receptor precursor [Croceibacterium atlanticum]MBB5732842.1 iron complex outermembrane receptor protein [Croceibacterium atlanticum]
MPRFLFATTGMTLLFIAGAAHAQEAANEEAGETARERTGLNVITVTAQRREETLQDAAIPINAASGAELARSGVVDATQLNKVAPALYVPEAGGANVGYFIRGVGNFANNGYTNPAVAFNLDGVYIGRPSSTVASFLDVDRVEVLKGPQGTLYGRNATGGAVNVIPNKPRLGTLEGSVSAQYGNYDALQLNGVINLPVGDKVAARFAGAYSDRDGYYSDGTGAAEDLALRGQLLFEISPDADIRLSADYSTQKGTGPGLNIDGVYTFAPFTPDATVPNWQFIPAPGDVSEPFTGLFAPQTLDFIEGNATAAPLYAPVTGYAYPFRDDEYWGINAELNWALGDVDLVVIPAFRRSELDNQFNGPPFKAAINQDAAEQFSIEGRLSGETGPLEWLLGAYYFDESVDGVNSYNQFSTVSYQDFSSTTESVALFARSSFSVTDDFRIVGGIRYTDESRTIDALSIATTGVCLIETAGPPSCPQVPTIPVGLTLQDSLEQLDPALFPAGSPLDAPVPYGAFPYGPFGMAGPQALLINTPTTIDRSAGDEEITWRAALEYDVTPDNLIYASFESGFRAGGFNLTFGQEEYDPEYIDAYTIGAKNSFFGNRLQLNVELFYWEYSGQQLAALGVDGNGNNSFFTRNVGESSIKGMEADFQLLATDTTLIRGGVQYLDATYDTFVFDQVDLSDETDPPNFLTPVTGCDYSQNMGPTRSFTVDCSGRPALNAPDWTVNLGIQQTFELRDYEVIANVDGRYRSDRVIGFNYLPTGNSGDDITINASLSLVPYDEGFSATLFVRNLTNKAMRSLYQLGSANVAAATLEPPRTYGIRLGYDF